MLSESVSINFGLKFFTLPEHFDGSKVIKFASVQYSVYAIPHTYSANEISDTLPYKKFREKYFDLILVI